MRASDGLGPNRMYVCGKPHRALARSLSLPCFFRPPTEISESEWEFYMPFSDDDWQIHHIFLPSLCAHVTSCICVALKVHFGHI